MSQSEKQPPRSGDDRVEELKSSANLMTLETGSYCLVNGSNPSAPGVLSGVRISPVDPLDANVTIASFRSDGWLDGGGGAALIRVLSGPAKVMVTIYQSASNLDSPPKIRVLRLTEQVSSTGAAPTAVDTPRRPVMILNEEHDVIAHVQRTGDVGLTFGEWAGTPGSQCAIEGFSLHAPEGLSASDLTYQAVLGRGWLSPWSESGQFCGSRGMALPLLGMKIKLSDAAAKLFDLTYEATFVDGSRVGPVPSEGSCETEALSPLEAMRVMLVAKSAHMDTKSAPTAKVSAQAPAKAPQAKASPVKAPAAKAPAVPAKPVAPAKAPKRR